MTAQPSLVSKLVAEFVGTFTLIAVGVGVSAALAAGAGDVTAAALAHGLAIGIAVTAVGHVSGAHLNPAVSVAMMVFRFMNVVEGLAYIAAQLAGAVVAGLLMMWGFGIDGSELQSAVPALADDLGIGNGILLEAVASFVLGWTIFAVAVDRDGAFFKVAGLPIGFAVTVGIYMVGGATGGAMNPARWFGPALLSTSWDDALVWIVGPIIGVVAAGALYLYGIRPRLAGVTAELLDA